MILDFCCDFQVLAGPHREVERTRGELAGRNVFERCVVPSDLANDTDMDRSLLFNPWVIIAIALVLPRYNSHCLSS
jgi:hypothetical protein